MAAKTGLVKANKSLGKLVKLLGPDAKVVTPQLTRFLLDHPDGIEYDQWVIDRVIAELTKKKRYRPGTFSASSAGQCMRAQVLGFLGMPQNYRTDVQLQNMSNDGTWRHVRYQANLLQAGIIDDIEFGLPWPKYRSMGSTDGIGHVPDDHVNPAWRGQPYILELKGAYSYKAIRIGTEGPETYREQVDRYMLVSGIGLVVIIVENRDSLEWTEYVYEADPVRLAKSRAELHSLNRAVDLERLPARLPDCEKHVGQDYRSCPFGGRIDSPCIQNDRWPSKRVLADIAKKAPVVTTITH